MEFIFHISSFITPAFPQYRPGTYSALQSQLLGNGVCFLIMRIAVIFSFVFLSFAVSVRAEETSIAPQFQTLYIVFFIEIVALLCFVLWDRRMMVKPVAEDQRSISERVGKLEHILKEYAKGEPRLAEILKQYALW